MESTVVLELPPVAGNARNSEGSFVTLKDGRILFAYSKFLGDDSDDQMPSIIVCRTSSDNGETWTSEDRILAEPENGAHNVMSVSLLRLQDDRILLFYLAKTETGPQTFQGTPMVRFSDDEMETLSEAVPLTLSKEYHNLNNDRVIQMASGRIVVPLCTHRYGLPTIVSPDGVPCPTVSLAGLVFFALSDDGGRTWDESSASLYHCFPDRTGLQEPGVIELVEGRLWSWSRTNWRGDEKAPRQWQSFSEDAGNVWSPIEPSQFFSPQSPLSMKRIPATGDLLAVWNDHSGRFPLNPLPGSWERTPLTCAISRDHGITWECHRRIETIADHGFCYTAIHFVDDAVLLAYSAGGASSFIPLDRLRVRRIPLAELYAQPIQ